MSDPNQRIVIDRLNAGAVTFGPGSPANGEMTLAGTPSRRADRPAVLLVVVAADVESAAFLELSRPHNQGRIGREFLEHHALFQLGTISEAKVLLAQVGQGTVTPDSAGASVVSLLDRLRPDVVVLAGICYGLKDDDHREPQQFGDLVVANQLRLIEHRKVTQATDETLLTKSRGGEVHPSPNLLDRFRSARADWPIRAKVRFGPVLSENVLVDSLRYRDQLKAAHPDAIGGEMEGSGVYAAAMRGKVDWALVKGVCDWGHGKSDDYQRTAAQNAASFVLHTAAIGGFDRVSPSTRADDVR